MSYDHKASSIKEIEKKTDSIRRQLIKSIRIWFKHHVLERLGKDKISNIKIAVYEAGYLYQISDQLNDPMMGRRKFPYRFDMLTAYVDANRYWNSPINKSDPKSYQWEGSAIDFLQIKSYTLDSFLDRYLDIGIATELARRIKQRAGTEGITENPFKTKEALKKAINSLGFNSIPSVNNPIRINKYTIAKYEWLFSSVSRYYGKSLPKPVRGGTRMRTMELDREEEERKERKIRTVEHIPEPGKLKGPQEATFVDPRPPMKTLEEEFEAEDRYHKMASMASSGKRAPAPKPAVPGRKPAVPKASAIEIQKPAKSIPTPKPAAQTAVPAKPKSYTMVRPVGVNLVPPLQPNEVVRTRRRYKNGAIAAYFYDESGNQIFRFIAPPTAKAKSVPAKAKGSPAKAKGGRRLKPTIPESEAQEAFNQYWDGRLDMALTPKQKSAVKAARTKDLNYTSENKLRVTKTYKNKPNVYDFPGVDDGPKVWPKRNH